MDVGGDIADIPHDEVSPFAPTRRDLLAVLLRRIFGLSGRYSRGGIIDGGAKSDSNSNRLQVAGW